MTHIGRTLQILNEMYYLFWLLSTTTYVDFTFHEIYNSYALYNWPNQEASLTSKYRSSKHWRNIHVQTNYIELDLLTNWEIVFEPDNDLASTMLRALAASRTMQSTDSGLNELGLILINRITKCYKMSYDLLAISYIVMLLCNLGSMNVPVSCYPNIQWSVPRTSKSLVYIEARTNPIHMEDNCSN